MKTKRFTLLALSALALSVAAQADVKYRVIDLGHLPGSNGMSEACAISPDGRVSGSAINAQGYAEQFYWDRATVMIGLGMLPMSPGVGCGQGINSSGTVVGYYQTPEGNFWPTVWDRENGLRKLPPFKGELGTGQAFAINELGQIVGENSRGNVHHACLWDPHLGTIDLGTVPGDLHSRALGIDDNGTIVGDSQGNPKSAGAKAFLWEKTAGLKNLGQLFAGVDTDGRAINGSHTVIGNGYVGGGHGYYWTRDMGMLHMESLAEALFGIRANDVNNVDQAVGQAVTARGLRAFIWTPQKGIVDLNFRLAPEAQSWVITDAKAINDQGWIAGTGSSVKSAVPRAVVLIPEYYPEYALP